jgi:hypothetical protein
MEYLIYISTAKRLLDEDELTEILKVSKKNNEENELTGLLLYSEGTFIQFLEGPTDKLNATYEAIVNGERHKNVIKLLEEPAQERCFSDWTMGFKSINSQELELFEGYFNPSLKDFEYDGQHLGLTIMKSFADSTKNL